VLRYVLYDLTLFSPGDDAREARVDLGWMLEALTQRNQDYLRQHPDAPRLYRSHVVYERPAQFQGECEEVQILRAAAGRAANEPKVGATLNLVQAVLGGERFRDIGRILERGSGDCDNLACWRVAELRQGGVKARPFLIWRKTGGGTTYHALVRHEDGSSEDPSRLLGMGGEAAAAERAEEIRKNAERVENRRLGRGSVIDPPMDFAWGGSPSGLTFRMPGTPSTAEGVAALESVIGARRAA
jgi:hypothetical protein